MSDKINLLIVGTMGNGKSTTGNTILERNVFKTGIIIGRITDNIQFAESSQYKITDTPGFGELGEELLFFGEEKKILEKRRKKKNLFRLKLNV